VIISNVKKNMIVDILISKGFIK